MFDHVTIRVSDRAAAEWVYERLLGTLGFPLTKRGDVYTEWDDFTLAQADTEKPATTGLHIGFRAPSREAVHAFWRAGQDVGLQSDGDPGPRPEYGDDYYGGFLLDQDGNSIEAVHHDGMPERGCVDHLWIRVADVQAAALFYERVGRFAGFERQERPERIQFDGDGTFSVLTGRPTANAHVAFRAPDRATVDAFHSDLTEAGHRDNGAPGERLEYHPGYYGAFVLDPDGNNIELVIHS